MQNPIVYYDILTLNVLCVISTFFSGINWYKNNVETVPITLLFSFTLHGNFITHPMLMH